VGGDHGHRYDIYDKQTVLDGRNEISEVHKHFAKLQTSGEFRSLS
jgi:hypothetical protein